MIGYSSDEPLPLPNLTITIAVVEKAESAPALRTSAWDAPYERATGYQPCTEAEYVCAPVYPVLPLDPKAGKPYPGWPSV
jgi:hypothetical protein